MEGNLISLLYEGDFVVDLKLPLTHTLPLLLKKVEVEVEVEVLRLGSIEGKRKLVRSSFKKKWKWKWRWKF
jgi:hypothetical protein